MRKHPDYLNVLGRKINKQTNNNNKTNTKQTTKN